MCARNKAIECVSYIRGVLPPALLARARPRALSLPPRRCVRILVPVLIVLYVVKLSYMYIEGKLTQRGAEAAAAEPVAEEPLVEQLDTDEELAAEAAPEDGDADGAEGEDEAPAASE